MTNMNMMRKIKKYCARAGIGKLKDRSVKLIGIKWVGTRCLENIQ